jgi:predicted lipoprotein with Yx(FWY)xxD motif
VKRITYTFGLLAVIAVAMVGCGGGGDSSSGGAYGETSSSESSGETSSAGGYGGKGGSGEKSTASGAGGGGAGVVSVANVGDLGTILVDSEGLTLYDFHKDKRSKSACYGACAAAWPPLLTEGSPKAEGEAQAGMLGTTKRKDGATQVTYNGWPLYTYAGDKGPGEANGNDIDQFGAEWYALQPNGEEPED